MAGGQRSASTFVPVLIQLSLDQFRNNYGKRNDDGMFGKRPVSVPGYISLLYEIFTRVLS